MASYLFGSGSGPIDWVIAPAATKQYLDHIFSFCLKFVCMVAYLFVWSTP